MVTASDMWMHHVIIILTLTFIQGNTYLNHQNNKCLTIKFRNYSSNAAKLAVKTVRLKVYMTVASPITLIFTQPYNCFSNLTLLLSCSIIAIYQTVFKQWHSNLQ